jgi:NAD(P)-dependent dehydrogenase (short-subunit alcohol dehydrogenase family)
MALVRNPRAVVTGAGRGLGRALCREIVQRGGRVVACDLDLDAARATVAGLGAADAHALSTDVSRLADVERLAGEAERLLGGIDLVVNIGEVPLADWEWILCVDRDAVTS